MRIATWDNNSIKDVKYYIKNGEIDSALELIKNILNIDMNDTLLIKEIEQELKYKDIHSLIDNMCLQARSLDHYFLNNWTNLDHIYRKISKFERAIYIHLLDKGIYLYLLDNIEYEMKDISNIHILETEKRIIRIWIGFGQYYIGIGNYDKAIKILTNIVKIDHKNDIAWNNLGIAHAYNLHFYRATKSFRRATMVNPKYCFPWINLGYIFYKLGLFAYSANSFKSAIENNGCDCCNRIIGKCIDYIDKVHKDNPEITDQYRSIKQLLRK